MGFSLLDSEYTTDKTPPKFLARVRAGRGRCESGGRNVGDAERASAGGEEGRAQGEPGHFDEFAAGKISFSRHAS